MAIRRLVYLVVVLLLTACPSEPPKPPEPPDDPIYSEWYEGELLLGWNPLTVPSIYTIEYQLYLHDLSSEDSHIILDRTTEPQFSLLPELEGDFLLGVNAIKMLDGEDFLEGPTCWSDDMFCVKNSNTFTLRVKNVDEEEPITKWRIIWR